MTQYSHSKLQSFEQCKLKFKFRYIDKIIPIIPKTIEAHLGSIVHDTLEWLYTQTTDEVVPTIDQTIVHFSENWQQGADKGFVIVNKTQTEKDYFNKGIQFLLDYYIKHQPFQDGTLELEKKITIRIGENNEHILIGYIDRLAHNKEKNELEIHDYKTANTMPSQEKIDGDRQLALYSIAIKNEFGQEKAVSLNWHYLAYNQKVTARKTNEDLEQLKKEIIELIKQIESCQDFSPTKSVLCDWCEYRLICSAWYSEEEIERNKKEMELKKNGKLQFNQKPEPPKEDINKYPTLMKYLRD